MVSAMNSIWTWQDSDVPQPRNSFLPDLASACHNGYRNSQYGYACPHMMMLSDDMISASRYDHLSDFVYAGAGGSSDADCGTCYQVRVSESEQEWRTDFPQLVVQVINSGFDVLPYQLDVFMGGGGFGFYTACNSDCYQNYCQGGSCLESMYDGTFQQWVNAQWNDRNLCYSGGIKWLNHNDNLDLLCRGLSNYGTSLRDNITTDSCIRTNQQLFHQNFVYTDVLRVQCPEGLVRITGFRRPDDDQHPSVHAENVLTQSCRGDRNSGKYCITTMQDCCKPSCAWYDKGGSSEWFRVDTCLRNGFPQK